MLRRNIEPLLQEAIKDTPVLLINGARHVGKTTLVQSVFKATHQYLTLEDELLLATIKKDPLHFLTDLKSPTIIDEVQRAPELFLPLKKVVDAKRRHGFFVLTSSTNVLTLPKLTDPLSGLIEIHTLWPFSQGEILGRKEGFIEAIFDKDIKPFDKGIPPEDIAKKIIKGGYPDAITKEDSSIRNIWFEDYLTILLEKDIKELSNIERLSEIPDLLNVLAYRVCSSLNTSDISSTLQLPNATLKSYLKLLQTIFIVNYLPGWSKNLSRKPIKLRKSPKVYLNDTGLLTDMLSLNEEKLLSKSKKIFFGRALENFVVMEILKQQTWSKIPFKVYHYKTDIGQTVDILLEATDGRIIGIKIKLSPSLDQNAFKGLEFLEKSIGKSFYRGLVLYMGDKTLSFGKNKHVVPLPALWET